MSIIPKNRARDKGFQWIRDYERALLADIDRTLTRVFQQGMELARKKGDMRSFEICRKYLQAIRAEKRERRDPHCLRT